MEHWKGKLEAEKSHANPRNHMLHSGSPHIRAMDHWKSPHLHAIPEPADDRSTAKHTSPSHATKVGKAAHSMLRLDAFLGEWLSPDYFDNITPPPGSKMMVAAAKADLLRRGDPIETLHQANGDTFNQGHFPGGWKSSNVPPDDPHKSANTVLGTMPEIGQALPKLGRASSHSVLTSGKRGTWQLSSRFDGGKQAEKTGYVPPTPSYAVSPAQPIPQGYVSHARDACIDVDYQWDSMRPPLDWGNGGEYGEEWSAMHRRFRKGLQAMISWYRHHAPLQEPDSKEDENLELDHTKTQPSESAGDDDTDTVLILVTHGAGCNALIGALTNQPVLIDVGMASITMAIRKRVDYRRVPQTDSYFASHASRRRSSIDLGISEDYDVKLTASTDHLRPGSHFLGAPPPRARSPSLPVRDKSPYRYERHVGSPTHQRGSSPVKDIRERKPLLASDESFEEEAFDGIKRATTTAGSNGGLWSMPVAGTPNPGSPADAKKIPIPRVREPTEIEKARSKSAHADESTAPININGGNGQTVAHHGLWGATPKAVGATRDQTTPKRRWTLTQA